MTTETWKPIPDFPGYEVSDHGRVRSFKQCNGGGDWPIVNTPQRILKPSKTGKYLGVVLSNNGITHYKRIASLVMLSFVGPCPDGLEVCHNDSDPTNDHLDNLRYDTHASNMADRRIFSDDEIIKIRQQRASGETAKSLAKKYSVSSVLISQICLKHIRDDIPGPSTKYHYTESEIIKIRQRRASGMFLQDLADEYGITESTMSRICSGKTYAYFGGPLMRNGVVTRRDTQATPQPPDAVTVGA